MKNIFFLFSLLFCFTTKAQTIDFYTTLMDTTVDEYAFAVTEFKPNNYIISGNINSSNNPTPIATRWEDDAFLIKVNKYGNITKRVALPQKRINDIETYNSNQIICAGYDDAKAWVAMIDSNLNIVWEWTKTVLEPNADSETFTEVIIRNNNIYLSGEIWGISNIQQFMLRKMTINGISTIDKKIPTIYFPRTHNLFEDFEDNTKFWLATDAFGIGTTPVSYVEAIQIDENLSFTDTLFFVSDARRNSFKWFDKDYIISGGYGLDNSEITINPPSGTFVWRDLIFSKHHKDYTNFPFGSHSFVGTQTYHGKADTSDYYALKRTLDFNQKDLIYLGGNSNMYRNYSPYLESFSFHQNDSWFFINCLDSMGNVQWQRYFGGDEHYYLMTVKATTDGGVLLLGTSFDYNSGVNRRNLHIIKLKNDIQVNTENVVLTNSTSISVQSYPNPAQDYIRFTIETNKSHSENFNLNIYSLNGQLLMNQHLRTGSSQYNISELKQGTYFYTITNKDNQLIKTGQFLKM